MRRLDRAIVSALAGERLVPERGIVTLSINDLQRRRMRHAVVGNVRRQLNGRQVVRREKEGLDAAAVVGEQPSSASTKARSASNR